LTHTQSLRDSDADSRDARLVARQLHKQANTLELAATGGGSGTPKAAAAAAAADTIDKLMEEVEAADEIPAPVVAVPTAAAAAATNADARS
jgi:hypothetical protein